MSSLRQIQATLSSNSPPEGERDKGSLCKSIIKKPAGRIGLAIALSLLVHAALLFGPNLVELVPVEAPLPPLTARLEPLPRIAAPPAAKKNPVPKPHAAAKPKPVTPADTAILSPVETSQPEAPPATEDVTPAIEAVQPVEEAPPAGEAKPAHPLPKHAQLTFIAYKGTDFPVGEARHRLEITDDKNYTLQVSVNTTGLASLFKTFVMNQQSRGTVSALGLRPDEFSESRITAKGKQTLSAAFDWQNKQLAFSNGNNSALPEQAQDLLSFLYQLSQLPLDQATLPLYISNGKKLERYDLAIGEEEEILTRFGKLRALPLRKIHAPGEEGLEIWLGLEYRLLPVKIRSIDRSGEIAGEMVISDIRVSDE
ncbi:MAG TPA: DUF3108 domain-containing protein [Gallionella sp.]